MLSKCLQLKSSTEQVTRKEGLTTHQIHNMCFAKRKLWLASPNGLAIYDSESITILNQNDGLLTHGLRTILVYDKQVLVCSDRGLNIIDADSLKILTTIATIEIGFGWCQCALGLDNGDILLGCAKGLHLWEQHSGKLTTFNGRCSKEPIKNLIKSVNGNVLVHTEHSGLWQLNGSEVTLLDLHFLPNIQDVTYVHASNGEYWITRGNFIYIVNFDFTLRERIGVKNTKAVIRRILPISANKVVVADSVNAYLMVKKEQQWLITETICSNVLVNDICMDELANIWIATDFSGLFKYLTLNDQIHRYSSDFNNSILAISKQEGNPAIILAGTNISYEILSTKPLVVNEIKPLADIVCWDIKKDSLARLWVASNQGLLLLDNTNALTLETYTDVDVSAGRCIVDLEDHLLYGSISGLFLFNKKNKSFIAIVDSQGNTLSYVYSLIWKDKSSVFITTLGRGIWIFHCKSKHIEQWHADAQLINVYDIDQNKEGEYAVAADNEIVLIKQNEIKVIYTSQDSVAAWTCRWFSESQILLGSSKGLEIINVHNGLCVFQINNYPAQQFWEFTTSRSLLRSTDNTFWCGLNEGAINLNLNELIHLVNPPLPRIKTIVCSASYQKNGANLTITEGIWSLDISVGSFWYWDEKSTSYQYRLLGSLADWREMGNNILCFSSLPVGEYLLEVRVNNNLTQTQQDFQLLMISVQRAGRLAKLALITRHLINSLISKVITQKNFWKMRSQFDELEQIVEQRTQELSVANQKLNILNESLANLSHRDQLTELYNRHAFVSLFDDELKRASRAKADMVIIMIDIDYFKPYNDNYGHLKGDSCLQNVALCLANCIQRPGDILARFGGEEFIIAIPNSTLEQAKSVANLCSSAIQELAIPHEYSDCANHITISIGVAIDIPKNGLTLEERNTFRDALINAADINLYKAKENGRNQVC